MHEGVIKLAVHFSQHWLILLDQCLVMLIKGLCLNLLIRLLFLESRRLKQMPDWSWRRYAPSLLCRNWYHLYPFRKPLSKRLLIPNLTDIWEMKRLLIIFKLILFISLFMAWKRLVLLHKSRSRLLDSWLSSNYSSLFSLRSAWGPCILLIYRFQQSSLINIRPIWSVLLILEQS